MNNLENLVFVLVIAGGVILVIHGIQISRDKRKPKVLGLEKQVLTVMAPPNVRQMRQALGRMRIIYGVLLISIAFWALFGG